MSKSRHYHPGVRGARVFASAQLVVALVAFSYNLVSLAVAQQSGEVPADISNAISEALRAGNSNTAAEPAPLRLEVPREMTPTPAEPLQGSNPPMLTGPVISDQTRARPPADAESLSPPGGPTGMNWSSPLLATPLPTTSQGNREEPLSNFHGFVDGCASGETIGPMSPRCVRGFHCVGGECDGPPPGPCVWKGAGPIPWQAFAQGDYVGPARSAHVPEYRLRVDDTIEFVFRITGQATLEHYRVQVGDTLRVEFAGVQEFRQDEVTVQPDGYLSVAMAGEVRAADRTLAEISADIRQLLAKQFGDPRVSVSAVRVNTIMQELRNTVDNRAGTGGQSRRARITPAGTVQLPAIGSIPAQGLTLTELKREIEAAYASIVTGLEVTPILERRAPTFVYVLGEVQVPGRYELHGPTTAMQGIALAGSWKPGANLRQVIVFRRDDHWNLMAAQLNLHEALNAKDPCPAGEVWLRDADIVLVPKRTIRVLADAVELLFAPGAYGGFPVLATPTLTTL